MYNFPVTKTTNPKARPADESKLGFGKVFTDHMFIMNYTEGKGWHDGRIEPYRKLELDPSAMVSTTVRKCSKVSRLIRVQTAKHVSSVRI